MRALGAERIQLWPRAGLRHGEREKSKGSTGITDCNNVITSFSSITAHTQLLDSKAVLCRVVFYVSQHLVLLGCDISWNTRTTIIKKWLIKSEGLFQCCINLVQAADVRGTASLFTTWQLKKKKDNVLASNSTFFLVLKMSLCYHYKPLWYVFHESFRCQGKAKIYNDH